MEIGARSFGRNLATYYALCALLTCLLRFGSFYSDSSRVSFLHTSHDLSFFQQGIPCQWDFTKLQFKCDKRPHSKSIYSVELPGSASDATSLSTNDEFTQPSRRSE